MNISKKFLCKGLKKNPITLSCTKNLSLSQPDRAKVALIGAGGSIGQSLALLLKYNPMIMNLTLQDVKDVSGIAADLSHIDTSTEVFSHSGPGSVKEATRNADVVVIAAGMPRKPGMSRDDLFAANAEIVWGIMQNIASPDYSKIVVITNPINSIIPLCINFLRTQNYIDFERRILGVTTLDCVRASYFYAKHLGKDPREVHVPVVGGHSEKTIVPLFSMSNIPLLDETISMRLTELVQQAGNEVVKAKQGAGSASLSMAYAANRFIYSLLEANYGKEMAECCYSYSLSHTKVEYFADIVNLQHCGIKGMLNYSNIAPYEMRRIENMIDDLKADIQKGVDFALKKNPEAITVGERLVDKWNLT